MQRAWVLSPVVVALSVALSVPMCATDAFAVIQVKSTVTVSPDDGVRGQAVITDPTSFDLLRGVPVTAIAVKEFFSDITVRDQVITRGGQGNALLVQKHILTPAEAYGFGLNDGYKLPPTTDPQGPWQGLCWPYRDEYDYFNNDDPLADDVGNPFADPPIYGFSGIHAWERGGPTDPLFFPGSSAPSWLNRGLTGNGSDPAHPATYFALDIIALSGDPSRSVSIEITNASAIVVTRDANGNYDEMLVTVPNFTTLIQLPEPASASVLLIAAIGFNRRRRR